MSNEREPLWSDERIAKVTHKTYVVADVMAVIPIELMRNLITAVRDDYEARIAVLEAQLKNAIHFADTHQQINEILSRDIAELEAQLAAERAATNEWKTLANIHGRRMLELEAQLAQRWEPVNEKFILTYDTGLVDTPKQFVRWNADDESVIVGEDDGNFHHCPLPDNIRICRLVESQPLDMPDGPATIPPDVRETLRHALDYAYKSSASEKDLEIALAWLDAA